MKKIMMFSALIVLIGLNACHKACNDKSASNFGYEGDCHYVDTLYVNPTPPCTTCGTNTGDVTQLTVWTDGLQGGAIDVWVGYVDSGQITSSLVEAPQCGSQNGFSTKNVVSGSSYEIYAQDSQYYWDTILLIGSGCNKLLLEQNISGKKSFTLSGLSSHIRTHESDRTYMRMRQVPRVEL